MLLTKPRLKRRIKLKSKPLRQPCKKLKRIRSRKLLKRSSLTMRRRGLPILLLRRKLTILNWLRKRLTLTPLPLPKRQELPKKKLMLMPLPLLPRPKKPKLPKKNLMLMPLLKKLPKKPELRKRELPLRIYRSNKMRRLLLKN